MPSNPRDYPENWREVVAQVLERAGRRCEYVNPDTGERCEARHHAYGSWRNADTGFEPWALDVPNFMAAYAVERPPHVPAGERGRWIILTTAHLCACRPLCGDVEHLRSYCQRHHNRADAPSRAQNAAATKARKKAEAAAQAPPEAPPNGQLQLEL